MSSKIISLHARDHPIKAVTIFQSSTAQLTRTFSVDLKSGSNVLEISGISDYIDRESPRIYGLGPDVCVFDVSCNTNLALAPHQRHTKHAAVVKRLEAKRKLLKAERDVRQTEFTLLDDAARSFAQYGHNSFDDLMDAFVARKRNAMVSVIETDQQIEELDTEMWLLNSSHTGKTATIVTATLLAKRDCKVELQLTYLVTGVAWKPYYDLHATTSDGKPSPAVSLHYCANITQNTGEDWTDAVLTLSTANSHALHSLTVPKVDPLRLLPTGTPPPSALREMAMLDVSEQQSRQLRAEQMAEVRKQLAQAGALPAFGSSAAVPQAASQVPVTDRRRAPRIKSHAVVDSEVEFDGHPRIVNASRSAAYDASDSVRPRPQELMDVSERERGGGTNTFRSDELPEGSVLDKNPLSLAYRVEGRVSIPSDGLAHRVPIAMLAFEAALTYVCVPRKTTSAFIEGRIKNTSEYELLAGPVSVFMDDSFVTKTLLGLIGVNESFTCVLGIDTSLKVSYQTKSRTEHEPKRSFAEPSKTTTRTIATTITNGHSFDLTGLVVRDAIPLGNADANIKVALRRPDGLAQAKDGEDVAVALPGVGDAAGQEAKVRWARTESGGGGEKEGLYEWVCELKAGKKVRLEAEWEVKAPSSLRWEEQLNIQFGRGKRE